MCFIIERFRSKHFGQQHLLKTCPYYSQLYRLIQILVVEFVDQDINVLHMGVVSSQSTQLHSVNSNLKEPLEWNLYLNVRK